MAKGDDVTYLMTPQASGPSTLQSGLSKANQGLGLAKQIGGLTHSNMGGLVGPTAAQGGSLAGDIGPALGVGTSIINLLQNHNSPNNYLQAAPGLIKGYGALTGSDVGG